MSRIKQKSIYQSKKDRKDPMKQVLQATLIVASLCFLFSAVLAVKSTYFPLILSTKAHEFFKTNDLVGTSSSSPMITHHPYPIRSVFAEDVQLTQTPTPTASPIAEPIEPESSVPAGNDFCLNVPVLYYHHIEPLSLANQEGHAQLTVDSNIFDEQMAYLNSHGYHSLSADQLVTALIARQQLPEKSIVITLDDGYVDQYTYAFPIFKKYNIIGNLMIPTGLIMNSDYLAWSQLKEMAGNPLIKIYNHTWSHAALGGASKEKIEFEITTSQNELQSELGNKTNIFTYPYGSYSPLAISVLQEHGFVAAFTTRPGRAECSSFLMTLHRRAIGNASLSSYGL